jgi:DNA-directed RNA polymerase subunit alpha
MQQVATLIREGRIEEAEQQLHQRQGEAGARADWHCAHGRVLAAKGEIEPAIEAFEAALQIDPNYTDATFHLAYVLDLHGEEGRAMSLYQALARRTPTYINALLNLATLYEDQGKYEQALKCVDRVLTEYPNHIRARMFIRDIASSMDMFYDEDQERTRLKRDAILDTPISDFELSVRSRNCLRKMNINTLGDLLRITEPELLAYKNFGETSLSEIRAMLSQKGLRLGQLREEMASAVRTMPPRRSLPEGSPEVLNKPLSEIQFSSRSRKCLQRLNLMTVGDMTTKTEPELLSIKNFGQTSLIEVKQRLADFGLTLRRSE